jgi:hypothetical protein
MKERVNRQEIERLIILKAGLYCKLVRCKERVKQQQKTNRKFKSLNSTVGIYCSEIRQPL